MLKAKVNQLSR